MRIDYAFCGETDFEYTWITHKIRIVRSDAMKKGWTYTINLLYFQTCVEFWKKFGDNIWRDTVVRNELQENITKCLDVW